MISKDVCCALKKKTINAVMAPGGEPGQKGGKIRILWGASPGESRGKRSKKSSSGGKGRGGSRALVTTQRAHKKGFRICGGRGLKSGGGGNLVQEGGALSKG